MQRTDGTDNGGAQGGSFHGHSSGNRRRRSGQSQRPKNSLKQDQNQASPREMPQRGRQSKPNLFDKRMQPVR